MDVLVHIALLRQEIDDSLVSPNRPVMAPEVHLCGSEHLKDLVDVTRPEEGVANLGAAQRVDVVHVVRDDLGTTEHVQLRKVERQLRGGLRVRRVLEDELHSVDGLFRRCFRNRDGRRQDADAAVRRPLPEAGPDVTSLVSREAGAVHEIRTPSHGDSGKDVLARGRREEALWRNDRDASFGDFLRTHHAEDASKVVDVTMREDDRGNRFVAEMFPRERDGPGGGFLGGQRIDHDPSGFTLDQSHVREVVSAELMNARDDFEEAMDVVQARLTPKAWIHACLWRFAFDERVGRHVPNDDAGPVLHNEISIGSHKAPTRLLKVPRIIEREVRGECGLGSDGYRGGRCVAGRVWRRVSSVKRRCARLVGACAHHRKRRRGRYGILHSCALQWRWRVPRTVSQREA